MSYRLCRETRQQPHKEQNNRKNKKRTKKDDQLFIFYLVHGMIKEIRKAGVFGDCNYDIRSLFNKYRKFRIIQYYADIFCDINRNREIKQPRYRENYKIETLFSFPVILNACYQGRALTYDCQCLCKIYRPPQMQHLPENFLIHTGERFNNFFTVRLTCMLAPKIAFSFHFIASLPLICKLFI